MAACHLVLDLFWSSFGQSRRVFLAGRHSSGVFPARPMFRQQRQPYGQGCAGRRFQPQRVLAWFHADISGRKLAQESSFQSRIRAVRMEILANRFGLVDYCAASRITYCQRRALKSLTLLSRGRRISPRSPITPKLKRFEQCGPHDFHIHGRFARLPAAMIRGYFPDFVL